MHFSRKRANRETYTALEKQRTKTTATVEIYAQVPLQWTLLPRRGKGGIHGPSNF